MGFPAQTQYQSVCDQGLGLVRPLKIRDLNDSYGWNHGSVRPPSYGAYGRLRTLLMLSQARSLLKPQSSVLEIAANDAALSACLALEGHSVTANDLREENLRNAVANFSNGADIRLLPGDIFEIEPSQAGSFDLVTACEIIEHVAHSVSFLQQLKRFLAPGGRILLTTPNGSYFRNKLPTHSQIEDFAALEKEQFKPDSDGHLFLITPEEMKQIATDAGLHIDEISVWGTPFISGQCGFRHFGAALPLSSWYALERFACAAPTPVIHRLGNSMVVVLSVR